MKKTILISLFSLLFLTACGFSMRGTDTQALDASLQQLQLNYSSGNELGQVLQGRLAAFEIELLDDAEVHQLSLGDEQVRERILSVNRNVRAGEYEITLSASFQLSKQGQSIFNPELITVNQIYEADPANAAAKTNEAELVKTELRQELVEQIIRRLETVR